MVGVALLCNEQYVLCSLGARFCWRWAATRASRSTPSPRSRPRARCSTSRASAASRTRPARRTGSCRSTPRSSASTTSRSAPRSATTRSSVPSRTRSRSRLRPPGGFTHPSNNAQNTVLRTNALSLGIAPGGVSVNMSTGTRRLRAVSTPAQGSQDVTLGYSGGQANLFGNIPGKNVGIDVTVNLQTTINSIARIIDQDVFQQPAASGRALPGRHLQLPPDLVTGAVQNYIPGVRLTGSLRIAPAITKDGKVRIAKATVQSDVNNPDRVALSACVYPYSAYVANNDDPLAPGYSTDSAAALVPSLLGSRPRSRRSRASCTSPGRATPFRRSSTSAATTAAGRRARWATRPRTSRATHRRRTSSSTAGSPTSRGR